MMFIDALQNAITKNNSLLCIGLDTDADKIPHHLKNEKDAVFVFNKEIVDITADLVCCYKINSAFYEARGADGILELKNTIEYIKSKNSHIPIILDAKRADIGNTNNGYITYAFDYLKADAITLHPYLGAEALKPFVEQKTKGLFILCKTSNPGASEIQNLQTQNEPFYLYLARKVANEWNKNNNCMLVAGATYPEEMGKIRKAVGDMFLLVPGIGAQGGDLEKTLSYGLTKAKSGLIIHSARNILYASNNTDFAQKAREEAKALRNAINKYR